MKQLLIVALALFTMQVVAQEHKLNRKPMHKKGQIFKDLSAEEVATLQTKRMTLDLDLNESQSDEIYKMNLENAKTRKIKAQEREKKDVKQEEITKDNLFDKVNAKLDKQIAHKQKMRSILNDSQYEKWERSRKQRMNKTRMQKRHRSKRH